MRRLAIVAGALSIGLSVGACGSKDERPPAAPEPVAPKSEAVAPTSEAVADTMSAAAPAPEADTVEAAAEPLPEAWARILKEGGCLGVSPDGDTAYVVVVGEDGGKPSHEIYPVAVDAREGDAALAVDGLTGDALAKAVRAYVGAADALRPCRTLPAADVSVTGTEVTVRGGGQEVTLFSWDTDPEADDVQIALTLVGAYDDGPEGSVFGVIRAVVSATDDNGTVTAGEPLLATAALSAWDRGTAPCTPLPAGTVTAAEPAAATVAEGPAEDGCLAMTPDGRFALFHTFYEEGMPFQEEDATSTHDVKLVGLDGSTPPELDAGCLAEGCTGDARKALAARFAALDLRACPTAETVVVGGKRFPVDTDDGVTLEVDGHARRVLTLTVGAHDGEDHESLVGVFQHPKGGPVFALVDNFDTGLHERTVRVLDTAALGFCAPTPKAPTPAVPPGASPEGH